MVLNAATVRQAGSKQGREGTDILLTYLVTTDDCMDMDILCPAGMKKTTSIGCLVHVNMAAAAPCAAALLGPKRQGISGGKNKQTNKQFFNMQMQMLANINA